MKWSILAYVNFTQKNDWKGREYKHIYTQAYVLGIGVKFHSRHQIFSVKVKSMLKVQISTSSREAVIIHICLKIQIVPDL